METGRPRAGPQRGETPGFGSGAPLIGNIPAPVVILSAVLAAAYLGLALAPPALADALSARFGFSPPRLFSAGDGVGLVGRVLPLATHILIHASVAHLLFNLLWLVVFGTPVARRLGGTRFLAYFTLCGAAGALFFALFHLNDSTLLIGASGGVTGLLGGLVRFAFHRPASKPTFANGVLPLWDRSVIAWSAVIILMNAAMPLVGPGFGAGEADIAWQAHVGGFLFGLVAFPIFDRPRR